MISAIKVDLEDNGLGGVHHRTLRSLGWLNYKTSNGSKPKRCQHLAEDQTNRLASRVLRFRMDKRTTSHPRLQKTIRQGVP